ncbi:hypothetical protein N4R57_12270 [Rhodobacteraceae bacterium D3-12]|nr:hypothetical protein N4R57_12270 [Rhodobacteraceae bacterium D3-12]
MNRALPLATIAVLALSPAAMAAGKHDNTCRDNARCTTSQSDRSGGKAHKTRTHTKVVRQKTKRTTVVKNQRHVHAKRALPGRALTHAELRRMPHAKHGKNYRVVNNRVVQVDGDTLKVVATLGLLAVLLNNR